MNKLKTLSIILIFLFCGQLAFADDVIYSPNEKFDIRTGSYAVVGKVNDLLYVYRGGPDAYYLDAYDDEMNRKATVMLDFIQGKVVDTRFITYPDKIVFLYQVIEGARVIQYAVLLDEKARMKKRPQLIGDTKLGLFGATKAYFGIAVSENKQKIAVYALDDRSKDLDASITWLTDSLSMISRVKVYFRSPNDIAAGEGIIDNDGKFYLPAYTPTGSKSYADQLWMLTMKPTDKKLVSHEMPLNSLYAAGTYMKLDNVTNRISVAGFYSDKKGGNYEGVLYNYYDIVTDSFMTTKSIPFDDELRIATGERNKKRAFNDYNVRQLIVKNDGGFVLVAEDYFISTRSGYTSGFGYYSFYYPSMSSSIREYHYNDIMVLSYNKDGRGQWRSFIRKEQYSQEDGGLFSSYAMINTGGALGFMFNDYNSNHSRVQLASVADDGQVDMHTLQSNTDNTDWLPRNAKQVSSREIVVPCLRKRQICFAKIVF